MAIEFTVRVVAAALCAFLLPAGASVSHAADTPAAKNFAAESKLPQGAGLAGQFKSDSGIAGHADVIFADDFEKGALGAEWDSARNDGGRVLALVNAARDDAPVGQRSLQVTATLGENTGGGLTKWFQPTDRLFIRFYTRFDPQCDYIHHFCTVRANKSLQGGDKWSGFGGAGDRPAGDTRFSTALEPFGNWRRWAPPGRWNFYSYWHTMTASGDGKYWGNSFLPDKQPNIQRDHWICAELMLLHNTPGQDDGEQACWIDGQLLGHWKGINWRTSPTLWANALTLESYVTDRWTKQKTNIVFFDNVVVAKSYIGPSGE